MSRRSLTQLALFSRNRSAKHKHSNKAPSADYGGAKSRNDLFGTKAMDESECNFVGAVDLWPLSFLFLETEA